jgi:hypothetical protein
MYFSYLRGRQYELLALKELAKGGLISSSVIPVVEPIKITSTLEGTLNVFKDAELPIALIFNPAVGDLAGNAKAIEPLYTRLSNSPSILPSVLLSPTSEYTMSVFSDKNISTGRILTVLNNRDYLTGYKSLFENEQPKYTLFPDERSIRRAVTSNRVLFEDKFHKQVRNADYPEDEFFSEDHLFYESERYKGFGDYSIIGDEYSESGFAPWADAIHIVYFDQEKVLRVRHFISDSNFGMEDVAGKYYEALIKLTEWYRSYYEQSINPLTFALKTLLHHYDTGYYPGLPTLKKLSIMHHLELMNQFLVGGKRV